MHDPTTEPSEHDQWMALEIQQPDDVPHMIPIAWQSDMRSRHIDRLMNNDLPADFPYLVERGTATDAVTVLALETSIRRDLEHARGYRIRQAVELGASWGDVAAALDVTPAVARALLRAYADGQRRLHQGDLKAGREKPLGFSEERYARVIALCDDDQQHSKPAPATFAVRPEAARYAAELRDTPRSYTSDGHTGWDCPHGASLNVQILADKNGARALYQGTVYACRDHRGAAVERIQNAGYRADPAPAPARHRWDPWPCGHTTVHGSRRADILTALAQDPTAVAGDDQGDADEEPTACARCRRPFDRADLRHDGHGRYASTPWCRSCVDNCRDGHAEHVCVNLRPRPLRRNDPMNPELTWVQSHPWPASIAGLLLLAAAVALSVTGRSATRRTPAAVMVASLAAMACTAYSADTSWRFAEHRLDMASATERAAMFAAAELALFACALMARQNLGAQGTPGTPGVLVWFITSVQVIPAYSESGFVGGTVRAVVGPILAALLWHLAMGIELRHSRPDAESGSLPALLAREGRERLLSRLGLAVRDRSAEQITRDRWTVKAVALAAKLAEMAPGARGRTRVARRLSVAVGKAQAGADIEQRGKLLELLAARRHAAALATIALPSPWEVSEETTVEQIVGERPELPPSRPEVVPAGARFLPVVAGPVERRPSPYRWDRIRGRQTADEPTAGDQQQALPGPLKPVIPKAVPWHWKDTATPPQDPFDIRPKVTNAVPAQPTREVVTQVITLTPGELLKRALKLNRERVSSGQRPVTIAQLQDEFGISRREATDLRRLVVIPEGS